MNHFLNVSCLTLILLSISVRVCAQTDFQREVEKEIARDADGKFLYEHSDAYCNRIERRVRQRFESKQNEEIQGSETGKDIYYDASDQNETTIAINRKDPNLIIAGSNDGAEASLQMPVYLTKDGGFSWHTGRLPALPDDRLAAGDPMIASGDDGKFYYAFLTNPKYAPLPIQLVVAVSSDGEHWSDMQPVGIQKAERSFQDKPTIVVDNSPRSPYHGRVYVSWTLNTDDKPYSGLRLAWSDNQGKSWSATKILTTGFNNLFTQLCIGRNGEVLVSYSSLDDSLHQILVSKDGGDTFDNRLISKFIPFPENNYGRASLKGREGFRAHPYPAIRVDLNTNRLHVVYGTWKGWSPVDSSAELLYTYSDDLGRSWNSPVIIGQSENSNLIKRDHFFPWLTYDEFTSESSLIYYSSEADPLNIMSMPYRAIITEHGLSNTSPIGDSLFNPLYEATHGMPAFIGDYIGCDAYKNQFAAAWTQNRAAHNDGDVFIFIGTTDPHVSKVDEHFPMKLNSDRLWLSNAYPNPSQENHVEVNFTIPESGSVGLDVFSTSGVLIKNIFKRTMTAGSYSDEIALSSIGKGFFIIRLSMLNASVETQLTILH